MKIGENKGKQMRFLDILAKTVREGTDAMGLGDALLGKIGLETRGVRFAKA